MKRHNLKHLGSAVLLLLLMVCLRTAALQTASVSLPQVSKQIVAKLNDNASHKWTTGRSMAVLGGSRVLWLEKITGEPTVFVDARAQRAPIKPKSVDPVSQPQIVPASRTGQADHLLL